MSAAALLLPHYTPAEYLTFERNSEARHEYYEGVIYAMAGGGSYRHSQITLNLAAAFVNLLRSRDCDVTGSDTRVQVAPSGPFFYPDLVIVCGPPQFLDRKTDTVLNPLLIVEVLSPSTATYDRTTKFEQYRRLATLREYVLVSQSEPRIEAYCREGRAEEDRETSSWSLREAAGLDSHYDCHSVGITVPLAEVYRRVDFGVASPALD